MELEKINKLEEILNNSHEDIGKGGKPIGWIYDYIEEFNPAFSYEERNEALIEILRFLLDNKMVKLAGIYDDKNNCEVIWEGKTEGVLNMLKDWFFKFPKKKLQKDSQYLFNFKYCFVDWLIPYPVDLKKMGQIAKSA